MFTKNYDVLRKAAFEIQSWNETIVVWIQFSPAEDSQSAKNRAPRQCWSLFRCCRYYLPRACSCRHHCEESLLFCSVETSVRGHLPCHKRAVPKQRLVALAWQGTRLLGRWMWRHFLLPNRSVWSSIPPTYQFCHRQIFPLSEGERVLKGRRFSDISNVQLVVTELLKGIELQDFQRTFEDLCKRSQCCLELVRLYGKVCKTSKYILSFFFEINAVYLLDTSQQRLYERKSLFRHT